MAWTGMLHPLIRSGGGQMIFVIGRTYFLVIRDLKGFHPACEKAPTEQDR